MRADFQVGNELTSAEFGPLSIVDTVRWAGVQENVERLHFDREFARQSGALKTFIVSGAHRQALVARMLTDRIGDRGRLLKLQIRHTGPTFEGDLLRCSARVTEAKQLAAGTELTCELNAKNREDKEILIGSCVLLIALT
jgi:acyl dehydratase